MGKKILQIWLKSWMENLNIVIFVFLCFFMYRLLRETVLGIACQMDDQEALNQANDIFNKWIDGTIR